MTDLPERPRLTDHVVVRRHLADDDHIVLHDHRSRLVTRILPVQWRVLALADGTRDVPGVAMAAEARGVSTDAEELRQFLGHLHERGLLTDGPTPALEGASEYDADLCDAPIVGIPGWTFTCSGRGVCCEVFPTILFSAAEANRAMALLEDEPHDFYPHRGAPREDGPVAPILVEGRCRYLKDDRRCALHAAGGPAAKPAGCRAFPMQSVFDGERIQAGFAFECACVVDGIDDPSGRPPVPEGVHTLGDVPGPTRVGRIPGRVALDDVRDATRDEVRRLHRALVEAPAPDDVAAALWAVGDALATGGVDDAIGAYGGVAPVPERAALAMVRELHAKVTAWREPLASFRSDGDLTRCALGWIADAAASIAKGALPPPTAERARVEAFYVVAIAWIYRDALGALPLSTAFRVRAIRVWLARAIDAAPPDDPRAADSLPLVEAMFRATGLDAFTTAQAPSPPT